MVKKSGWSDKQLEAWIRDMPKIEDHRDPRDIYKNISTKIKKQKKMIWFMPSIATFAAIIIVFILATDQFNQTESNQSALDVAEKKAYKNEGSNNDANEIMVESTTNTNEATEKDAAKEKSVAVQEENYNSTSERMQVINTQSVYKEDLNNKDLLTYVIPDKHAEVLVPITVLIPKTKGSTIDKWNEAINKFDEEEWGLRDYYPLAASIEIDSKNNQLIINVNSENEYTHGSAAEHEFTKVVGQLATVFEMKKVMLFTDGNLGVEFGNYGSMTDIPAIPNTKKAFYLFYPEQSEEVFLVPSTDQFESLEQALEAMAKNQGSKLQPSIAEKIHIEKVEITKDEVTVVLKEGTELLNDSSTIQSIEAILLAAKSFGYQKVKFENTNVAMIGDFILSEFIDVPVAENKKIINE